MANDVILETPSRLHFGLIDLGGVTRRSFGGAGCFISSPSTKVTFSPIRCRLRVGNATADHLRGDVAISLDALLSLFPNAVGEIEVLETPFAHVGFGSKTAAILGALKCAAIGNECVISDDDLKLISRRGGASGVGVHGFFEGGMIVDCGHGARPVGPWLPSSAYDPSSLPIKAARLEVPSQWRFHLMMPHGKLINGKAERIFFENQTPLDAIEVFKSLAAIWHGLVPAFVAADLDLLRLSLRDLSCCGLKKYEIEAQPESQKLIGVIEEELSLPVGMSSLGPLVFCISEISDDVVMQINLLCEKYSVNYIGEVSPANHGFVVS